MGIVLWKAIAVHDAASRNREGRTGWAKVGFSVKKVEFESPMAYEGRLDDTLPTTRRHSLSDVPRAQPLLGSRD